MIRLNLLKFSLLFLGLLLVVACSGGGSGSTGDGGEPVGQSELAEPPEEYASFKNPHEDQPDAISEGESLFQANCSSCHGMNGEGDGPASAGLNPKPKNLAQSQESLDDAYLYWRIAEGGLMEPFNSVMPAWRGILDEEEIWQIVSYIRTLE